MIEYPKVLVISNNPFSHEQNNSKTLSVFFDNWPKDRLAQIYLCLDKFEVDICENFFRLTDVDILNMFVKHIDTSKVFYKVTENEDEKKKAHTNKFYLFVRMLFKNNSSIANTIKNCLWRKTKPWNWNSLDNWIKDFNPDLIFFQTGDTCSSFWLVMELQQKYNIPVYLNILDDFTTINFSVNPFYLINKMKFKKVLSTMIKNSLCVFAISDEMEKVYSTRYGGKYKVANNSINLPLSQISDYDENRNKNILITYAGNIDLGRWKTLYKIGRALKNIYCSDKIDARLEIYTKNRLNKRKMKKLNINGFMEYKGALNSEELIKQRNKSDFLLIIEAFGRKERKRVKLSFSTKISECVLSKRCILAVGPSDVASIKFINDKKIGYVITKKSIKHISEELKKVIIDKNKRKLYINNCKGVINSRFSFENNRRIVQDEIIQYKKI